MELKHGRILDELLTQVPLEDFVKKFKFRPDLRGRMRVRRECVLLDEKGDITAQAPRVVERIAQLHPEMEFYPGITNCHLSMRTKPVLRPRYLFDQMSDQDGAFAFSLRNTDIKHLTCDILHRHFLPPAEERGTTARYRMLEEQLEKDLLEIAVRTHTSCFEFYPSDMEEALAFSNRMRQVLLIMQEQSRRNPDPHFDNLVRISGKKHIPPVYNSVEDFHAAAVQDGFAVAPARSPHLVSISAEEGTVRCDFYKCTEKLTRIVEWAEGAHDAIRTAVPRQDIEGVNVGDTAG